MASADSTAPRDDDAALTIVSVEVIDPTVVSVEKVSAKPPSPTETLLSSRSFSSWSSGSGRPSSSGRSSPPCPAVVGVSDLDRERRPSQTLNTAALSRARSSSSLDRSSSAAALLADVHLSAAEMGGSRRMTMDNKPVDLYSGSLHRQVGTFGLFKPMVFTLTRCGTERMLRFTEPGERGRTRELAWAQITAVSVVDDTEKFQFVIETADSLSSLGNLTLRATTRADFVRWIDLFSDKFVGKRNTIRLHSLEAKSAAARAVSKTFSTPLGAMNR